MEVLFCGENSLVFNETGDDFLVLEDESDLDTWRVGKKREFVRKLDTGFLIHRVKDARGLSAHRKLRV